MKAIGRRVKVAPRLPVFDGINAVISLSWSDEQRCSEGLRHLRCYRYGEMQS
jgi:hypothetical protein